MGASGTEPLGDAAVPGEPVAAGIAEPFGVEALPASAEPFDVAVCADVTSLAGVRAACDVVANPCGAGFGFGGTA